MRPTSFVLQLAFAASVTIGAALPAAAGRPGGGGTTPPPPPVRYAVTWLDVPGSGAAGAEARDLNDRGDVVGRLNGTVNVGWAWLPEAGGFLLQDVALPPSDGETLLIHGGNGINNNREVVGWCTYQGVEWAAYRLRLPTDETGSLLLGSDGKPVPTRVEILPPPAGAVTYGAHKTNDFGDVTVYWTDAAGSERASLFTGGGYLDTSARKDRYVGAYLNRFGQVAGGHVAADGRRYGFRATFDPATAAESFEVFGGFVAPGDRDTGVSSVFDVNDAGQVAGSALYTATVTTKSGTVKTAGRRHAFVGDGVSKMDLGVLGGNTESAAYGINELGQAAGVSGFDGFLWTPQHGMLNLDALVLPDARWSAALWAEPKRINDPPGGAGFGQIVGKVLVSEGGANVERAFLLTPVAP